MENGLSASDVAMLNGNNGWGDNGFMWVFALLILAGGGFGGFNRNGYMPQYATQDFVQNGFNFNDLQDQNRDILAAINSVPGAVISAVKDASYQNLQETRDLQSIVSNGFANSQKCCCDTLRAIDSVNYNGAINTASINANTTAVGQKILDALSADKISALQIENQALKTQAMIQEMSCGLPRISPYMYTVNPVSSACGCNGYMLQ